MMADSMLHLPDITIKGFRGIEDLTLPRLGRATLLVGKNGVGKTTVMEAVQAYAARGRRAVLQDILAKHEELRPAIDERGRDALDVDWPALFHRRDDCSAAIISIGPAEPGTELRIERTAPTEEQLMAIERRSSGTLVGDRLETLRVVFRGNETVAAWWATAGGETSARITTSPVGGLDRFPLREHRVLNDSEPPPSQRCESLGPDVIGNPQMAQLWDAAVTHGYETDAVDALRLVFGDAAKDVAVIGGTTGRLSSRRALVRIEGWGGRRPLKSLGDGAVRLFGVALALAHSRDGFLLIDEAENGIHYSLRREYWRMVLQTAERHNVQVIATTHSADCIRGFAAASADLDHINGALYRLSDARGSLRAVEYDEEELVTAAEQGIEVR